MTTGFKMVRIPDELAERITATGQKREPFVRQAIEAALERPSAGTEPTRPAAPRAAATSAPVNYAMERQRKLNDAKYGRRS